MYCGSQKHAGDFKQQITARISDDGRCFFGRNAVGLKDFCGAGEIDG
jgi:hypothetical protein